LLNIEILDLQFVSVRVKGEELTDLFVSLSNLKNLNSLSLDLCDNFTDITITEQQSDTISKLSNLKNLQITLRFSLKYNTHH